MLRLQTALESSAYALLEGQNPSLKHFFGISLQYVAPIKILIQIYHGWSCQFTCLGRELQSKTDAHCREPV